MSSDLDTVSYSSSDESILRTQAKKLFKYADVNQKGYIVKGDLEVIRDYIGATHLATLEQMLDDNLNEKFISEKEFVQMIHEIAKISPDDTKYFLEDDKEIHPIDLVSQPESYSLAAELSLATSESKFEDPLVDMLRNQLDSSGYPFIVENVAARQNIQSIVEKPGYSVSIKKPQFRPIEPGDLELGSKLAAPSLADELNEIEEGLTSSNPHHQLDTNNCIPDRIFKVVFVGDSAVGKTCFLHRFCHNRFKPLFNATIGVDFTVKTIAVQDKLITLQLWDTAGQERFRSITKQYFRKADGVVLMFDVTSEQSFLHVRNWIDSVKAGVDENTVMCLVGNKVDLFGNDGSRKNIYQAGKRLADEFHMPFFETSAFTGFGIENCMRAMAMSLQKREDDHLEEALRLEPESSVKRRSWCCL